MPPAIQSRSTARCTRLVAVSGSCSARYTARGILKPASVPRSCASTRGQSAVRGADDDRRRHLVEARVGHAQHAHLLHAGRVADRLLDLRRREVLAADADELLQPRDVAQLAVVVERAEIAGAQPAVGGEGVRVGLAAG